MAYNNTIGILLAAKDEASAVIRKTAAETKAASGEVNALGSSSSKTGDIFSGKLLPALLTVGGTVALFSEATHKAGDFQQQLTKLVTSAGESESNLGLVGSGIKKLSIETGASVTDLANGMYIVESAGQHGADGLMVLKAAEQGAKAEGSDLATVADAVTSALKDYHLGASDAAAITSKLVAATGAGKTTFQDLAAAMPAILPTASAAHVSLNDILGDLASMTVHGMSADQAAQNLAHTIRSLENPTAVQAKEFALLGLTTTQMSDDLKNKGVSGTLQEIATRIQNMIAPGTDKVILNLGSALKSLPAPVEDLGKKLLDGSISAKEYAKAAGSLDPISAKQAISFSTLAGSMHRIGDQQMTGAEVMQSYTQALAKATGTSDGLNVALMLTGENAQTTTDAINAVAGATAEAGNNVKGWADIQNNFNTKWDQFKQLINVGVLTLGQHLLPVATDAIQVFVNFGMHIADSKQKMMDAWQAIEKYLGPSFSALGSVISNEVVPMLGHLWKQVIEPLVPVIGILFVGALKLTVDTLTALLQIVTPVVDFLITNKDFLAPIIGGFIGLKAAMMLGDAFDAVKVGFATFQLITIPGATASFEAFSALVATPLVMPAIAIGAALAAIAAVWDKYNQMMAAVNQADSYMQKANDARVSAMKTVENALRQPGITDARRAQLEQSLSNLANQRSQGYALGTSYAPGGIAMVGENGPELVNLPRGSQVHTASETQKMLRGGSNGGVTINGGLHIHNNLDEQRFLKDLGWRLSLS